MTLTAVSKDGTAAAPCGRGELLFAVKAVHSLAFFVIQTAILFLLYKGLRRQTDRRAAIAAAVALGESAVYAANGFRCPLTGLAEQLGAERGSITDIFLPRWLAANVANIYTPLLVLALGLHAGNVLRRRCGRDEQSTPAGRSSCSSESLSR